MTTRRATPMRRLYEHLGVPPISRERFLRRLAAHVAAAIALLVFSVGIGMIGYARYEHLAWRDGFLNSAMLLGGMGPVDAPRTDSGKLFAGFYALYAGLVFIVIAGIVLAPVVHRLLHLFHWEGTA
jgi:hypothetical protein